MQVRARYEEGRDRHGAALAALEARSRGLGTARLGVAAAAVALIGGMVWGHLGGWAAAGLGLLLLVFLGLVAVHARVHDAAERARAGRRFHERGLARLALAWEQLPATSERFRKPDHPFAGDLDVFGHASLMQILDATETRFGEERLAALLSLEDRSVWPAAPLARQEAARELVERFAFRENLAMSGAVLADERPDPAPLLAWAEAGDDGSSGFWRVLPVLAWLQPLVVLTVVAVGPALGLPRGAVMAVSVAALGLGIAMGLRLARLLEAASAREGSVTRWRAMIGAIEKEELRGPLLQKLRGAFLGGGSVASATQELRRLEGIVGFTDARRNEVFRFFIGPFLMWDAHCALALRRWKARAGGRLRVWLEALGEVEALASVAAFASEHPDFVWPELVRETRLAATGLGHPLIPADRRVANDVQLPSPGRALVVTGSNMSGKSTLLRALGTNVVLAAAGAPVCAAAFAVGPLRVATSMRIADSLEQGVSHFYAELRRLKRVLDWAHDGGAPVLFLLDEILHGTNSRERIIGACGVVRQLVAVGALGAVSTHDLGITALERELPGRVENAHFEEQVRGDEMTFDYVLRPGIVQSSNALRLMRAVGIAVGEVHEGP